MLTFDLSLLVLILVAAGSPKCKLNSQFIAKAFLQYLTIYSHKCSVSQFVEYIGSSAKFVIRNPRCGAAELLTGHCRVKILKVQRKLVSHTSYKNIQNPIR